MPGRNAPGINNLAFGTVEDELGATCSLLLAVVQVESLELLCLGLRVNDEPENPFTVMMPTASPQEKPLLDQILKSGKTILHCLNELNHPMLRATCSLEQANAATAAEGLCSSGYWLLTPESAETINPEEIEKRLDLACERFKNHIFRGADQVVGDHITMAANIGLKLEVSESSDILEVTPTTSAGPFRVTDRDEGAKLERQSLLLIDSVYSGSCYRSPTVQVGESERELTDVLAFSDSSMCVIQAKALSILNVDPGRPSSRRSKSVTKQVKKALRQVKGAMRNLRSDLSLCTVEGQPLTIPNRGDSPAHAIVLLSEMYWPVDWTSIATAAAKASEDESFKAFFHVMDLRELATITLRCPNSQSFFERLIQHWALVRMRGTSYIRTYFTLDT